MTNPPPPFQQGPTPAPRQGTLFPGESRCVLVPTPIRFSHKSHSTTIKNTAFLISKNTKIRNLWSWALCQQSACQKIFFHLTYQNHRVKSRWWRIINMGSTEENPNI